MDKLNILPEDIASLDRPLICLDTCSILDIAKDPSRTNVTVAEQISSLSLLNQVVEQKLISLITDRVVLEFGRWISMIREETAASIRDIYAGKDQKLITKTNQLAINLDINASDSREIMERYASDAAAVAQNWMTNSVVMRASQEIRNRASKRVENKIAPSRQNKTSYEDCEILESYLQFAKQCRQLGMAFIRPILFISSNTSDFTKLGSLHIQIAPDFDLTGMTYSRNMFDAHSLLSENRPD